MNTMDTCPNSNTVDTCPSFAKDGLVEAGPLVSVGGALLDDPGDKEPARGAGAR